MAQAVSVSQMSKLSDNLKHQGKKLVLVGGCFDILHPGHVVFLEHAKKAGDILAVMLESDEKVRQLKGANRPVHNQKMRAKVLSALKAVDFVIMLPVMTKDSQYDELVKDIKPDVIAATSKNANMAHYQRAARLSGAKLKPVTSFIGQHSTSSLIAATKVQ